MQSHINDEEAKKRIDMFRKRFLFKIKETMALHEPLLITYIRENFMSGPTSDTTIRRRSGNLANSMRSIVPKISGDSITGGITFGKIYAKVHIGPKGKVTTIKPRTKKYLTIPLPAMQTKGGKTKATAAELMDNTAGLPFGNTFITRSKKGNLIIFGTQRITKGGRLGEFRGDVTPLFLLKKQVKIKARVHRELFFKWSAKQLSQDFAKKGIKASITYG